MTALSITDAIAAHHKAWHAVFTAPPGQLLQAAMQASVDALDVLLGTPSGTHQGAKDLLAYLRWWLDEVGPFSSEHGEYPPPYFIVQARVADLAMLLFEPGGATGLEAFAREVIGHAGNGDDLDGATIQSLAVSHRLLTETVYDPAAHGPSSAQPGDSWFAYAGPLATSSRRGGAE